MTQVCVRVGKYEIVQKPTFEDGKYLVTGGGKPYIVTVRPDWKGARCSCPQGIFRARKLNRPCKHEAMVRGAIEQIEAIKKANPNVALSF